MAAPIGDQELALLQYLDAHPQWSVAEAVAGFGEPRGLARSTVLTMMERLRRKGFLSRQLVDGVYRYGSATPPSEVLQGAVARFVQNTLSGSVQPFVAWMARRSSVSDEELKQLEALVADLRDRRGDAP